MFGVWQQLFSNAIGQRQSFGVGMTRGKSFGLLGMQERALSAGGQLDIETMPGNGTRIRLTLPLCEDSRP